MKKPHSNPDHSEKENHRSGKQTRESIRKVKTHITDFFKKKEQKKGKQEEDAREQTLHQQAGKQEKEQVHKKGIQTTTKDSEEDEWWGDEMTSKQDDTIRIFHQNVNGMKYDRLGGDMGWYAHFMKDHQIDIMGISEHNVDNCSSKVATTILEAIRRTSKELNLNLGGTKTKTDTPYKPGGTLSLVQGNMRGRVIDKGKDDMGRWVYEKLRGKKGRNMYVITAYQVCKDNPTANLTAAAQQLSALKQSGDNATPREAFKRDLSKFVTQSTHNFEKKTFVGPFCPSTGFRDDGSVF